MDDYQRPIANHRHLAVKARRPVAWKGLSARAQCFLSRPSKVKIPGGLREKEVFKSANELNDG